MIWQISFVVIKEKPPNYHYRAEICVFQQQIISRKSTGNNPEITGNNPGGMIREEISRNCGSGKIFRK
jgi:hypothetical protein